MTTINHAAQAPATFGQALSAGLGGITNGLMMFGNLTAAGEKMSSVVLQKATHYAEISLLEDNHRYAMAKAAVDARLLSLKERGVDIDIE